MSFEAKKEGNRLLDLVRSLSELDQDTFLETFTAPCLLQIPVEGAFGEVSEEEARATERLKNANAASTMHMSLKDLEGLRRSKNVEEALIHFLPEEAETVTIGRSPDCDLILNTNGVSRQHAELRKQVGNWLLVDLDSHNGTFINGHKLEPQTPTPVQDRQNLWFGSYRALFLYPEQVYNLANNLRRKASS